MEKIQSQHKFCAEINPVESKLLKENNWNWVTTLQVVAGFFIVSNLIYYANMTEGWKGCLPNLVAIGLLFWFVSNIHERIAMYKAEQNQRTDNLTRQMTAFICDSAFDPKNLLQVRCFWKPDEQNGNA